MSARYTVPFLDDLPFSVEFLLGTLVVLTFLAALFSSAETGMMALNRYRLRHLNNSGHRGARRATELLSRPDRLIGVILIGNTLVNFAAASVGTMLAVHWFGDSRTVLFVAPMAFGMVFLVFAEVMPKTFAALRPEQVAFPASWVLKPLVRLATPVVWLVNFISNSVLRLFRVNATTEGHLPQKLSPEELRTIVHEAGNLIPEHHQRMLLNILDLEDITVDDIMVPRSEIAGIDLDDDIDTIVEQLRRAQHTRLAVYKGDINNLLGILHLRKTNTLLDRREITREDIMAIAAEPYFVPEGTPLHTQLINFRNVRRRVGIVVDEYGDVLGLVTLEDILEEIVGEFTTSIAQATPDIHPQPDGSFLIDGSATIREINRALNWNLPTDGPKTLNGLVIEKLEAIPESNVSIRVSDYLIEILRVEDNVVQTARLLRRRGNPQTDWISGGL